MLIPQSLATVVEFYPPRRPTSATVRFLSPAGVELATPAATVDTLQRTISAVTDAETVTVTGATGTLVAGSFLWWVSADAQEARVLVSRVDSTAVVLEWPVPQPLAEVNDTLKGARITTTITALAAATLGEDYAIEWTVTNADGTVDIERQCAHVVRAKSRPAVDVGLAKSCVTAWWPGYADGRQYGYFLDLANRSSDRLFRRIRRTGRYPHLLWQSGDFEAAGRIAIKYELAVDEMIPANTMDRNAYMDSLVSQIDREIEDVISSRGYDANDSGSVESTEIRTINSVSLRRT